MVPIAGGGGGSKRFTSCHNLSGEITCKPNVCEIPKDRVFAGALYESVRLIWILDVYFCPLFCLQQDNRKEIQGMFSFLYPLMVFINALWVLFFSKAKGHGSVL